MSGINYLDGYIYHMVHLDTLKNIFLRRALLSKEKVLQEQIPYRSIANDEVQGLRDRIFVWDISNKKFRPLHSYVPFYFATHTPMLYNKYREGIQNKICIFEVSRSILLKPGAVFTDGNASKQQLSDPERLLNEYVQIVPATASNSCRRRYLPGGRPYGTSLSHSDFYGDVVFLERLDWDGIYSRRRIDPLEEYLRVRSAEVLIPDLLPLGEVNGISVKTYDMVRSVNALIEETGLAGRFPSPT